MPENDRALLEERIRRTFAAWNAGDFDGWLEDTHPDIEYGPGIVVGPASGERVVYRGPDELRGFFDEWHSEWRMEITVTELEEVGDWFVILGHARLTGVQSGAAFEQDVGWIAQLEDDLLRRLYSFPSHEEAREAATQRA